MNKKEQIMAAGKLQVLNSIKIVCLQDLSTLMIRSEVKNSTNRPILGIIAQQFRIERII